MIRKQKPTVEDAVNSFEENLHRLTTVDRLKLEEWCKEHGADLIIWAVGEAVKMELKAFRYVKRILVYYKENILENVI